MDEIFAFHAARTGCHIDTLNYFAQLIGYQFPEHDSDKNLEPYRTGYAYINYARHHQNCTVSPQQLAAFQSAHDEHHTMQPHHVRHYATMVDVPDVRIIEMVCDWFSANFEENAIVHTNTYANVMEFFDRRLAPEGFYVMDEPEGALTYRNQYNLAVKIREAAKNGCQFIVATHSPVIAAIPEADIYQCEDGVFEKRCYEQLDNIGFLEMFMRRRDMLFKD